MALLRKKPIVVNAELFDPDSRPWPKGVKHRAEIGGLRDLAPGDYFIFNERAQCWQRVLPGDYIITGVRGCRYPCVSDVFAETYEPVKEESRLPVSERKFVVAGTFRQYQLWCDKMKVNQQDAVFVDGIERLQGLEIRPEQVFFTGNYFNRSDIYEIHRELKVRYLMSAYEAANDA